MTLYGSGYEFFFFYFFLTVIPEDISGTFLHAYFPAVRTVFDAFSVVNLNDIFVQADCLSRTDLDANLTRDAPCFAYPLYLLSGILGLAGDPNPGISRNELDNSFWAGSYASPAAHTEVCIHNREIINHGDGIKRTGFGTIS